jgi:8-oxo-dGTP pyrophosphatase MutT (NUDIX family)
MSSREESFGVIPLSSAKGHLEIFLIQHKHGRYWGFPKGHAEKDETREEAATRELKEETNLDIVQFLKQEPVMEEYDFLFEGRRIYKRVYYFIAEVTGHVVLQKKEISGGIWLTFPDAMVRVTHQEGKDLLRKVEKLLALP